MYSFKKSKKIKIALSARETFLVILTKLTKILSQANLTVQTQVIKDLIDLLNQQKDDEFVKLLNGIDMWGGSGAVWEVHFEDNHSTQEFEKEMIKLINLMEKNNMLGRGIKPIQKLFEENIEGKE